MSFFLNNKMLLEKYNSIMEKSEAHRNKWALGLSVSFTVVIFISFAFYKGYLSFGFGSGYMAPNPPAGGQVANVISAKSVPSPIENTKETFKAAFDEISTQYQDFMNSVSNVLGPFFTGIEIYQRK